MIKHLTIIGIGLIGGSLARALKEKQFCERVTGCARRESGLQRAVELGVIDDYSIDPASAVNGADLVLLAIPPGSSRSMFSQIKSSLRQSTVVTDAGSVKGSVVEDARIALGEYFPRFVPGHPIAGTERSGVEASFAELFEQHRVILTPVETTDPEATATVKTMWEVAGASVDIMDPERHDEVLAATSHVPHVLAYSLVNTLSTMEESGAVFRFAAGGFADFTRIASSSPEMWHDIVLANRESVIRVLEHYENQVDELKDALIRGESDRVMALLSNAKRARDEFSDNRNKRKVDPATEKGEE